MVVVDSAQACGVGGVPHPPGVGAAVHHHGRARSRSPRRAKPGTRSSPRPLPESPAGAAGRASRTRPPPPARRTAGRPRSGSTRRRCTRRGSRTSTTPSRCSRRMFSSADLAVDEWVIIGTPRRGLNPRKNTNPEPVRDHPSVRDALGHVPRRVHVQPVNRAHALQRDRFGGSGELPARVVHQDVDAPEPLADLVEERLHLLRLADVGRPREAFEAAASSSPRTARAVRDGVRRSPPWRRSSRARARSPGRSPCLRRSRPPRCPRSRRVPGLNGTPQPSLAVCRSGPRRSAGVDRFTDDVVR